MHPPQADSPVTSTSSAPAAPTSGAPAKPTLKTRLTRWAAGLFIGGYLSMLSVGVGSHAMGYGESAHPLMYYIVWDMFCGWSAQSHRTHVLAEGESGTWYEAGIGPWHDDRPFQPYGDLDRIHYDMDATHSPRMALNVLRHTSHEPITRIAIVEEVWAKKYNLPEPYWSARWNVPKMPTSYYAVRHVLTADGQLLNSGPAWSAEVARRHVQDREKIRRLATRTVPLMAGPSPATTRFEKPLFAELAD
ncbi:hypothetical protein [Alienimonas chondri]|uniref:DUF2931 family protein n=1 Tax=Alienimonas chondri TaxID=2681879 RepID=A0ABX1VGC3_9PLAN|nr:hypothetical protein [Alienimonas chondri]NNJ26318.1 hypothetical protein [Alienimonas chondri]